jgi:hypothetical protein
MNALRFQLPDVSTSHTRGMHPTANRAILPARRRLPSRGTVLPPVKSSEAMTRMALRTIAEENLEQVVDEPPHRKRIMLSSESTQNNVTEVRVPPAMCV